MAESRRKAGFFLAVGTGDLAKVKSLIESDVLLLAEMGEGIGPITAGLESGNKRIADFLAMKALEALRSGLIPKGKIKWIIHDLGEAHVSQAVDDLANFLRDEDPKLRDAAVVALAFHMDSKSHRPEFERMLFEDTEREVRMVAAMALGSVLKETRDYRATRLLLKKLHSGDDAYVRVAAYEALLEIWLPEAEAEREWRRWHRWPMSELWRLMSWEDELQQRVDWAFIEGIQRQVEYAP